MNTGAKRVYGAEEWIDFALNLCRGSYQRALIEGRQRVSGADLRGRASKYSGRYAASRSAIIWRCRQAGIPISIITCSDEHGRRRLVIAGRII